LTTRPLLVVFFPSPNTAQTLSIVRAART
jgi:hypothetical protein